MSFINPDITFILPIYKTPEDFLTQCVQSIIEQTHTNIEVVLVDDGSPDNCPTLCDSFSKMDKRITVIHQKNAGVGNARNTGLRAARGTWVCFIDPDDWINTDMSKIALEEALIYFKTYAEYPNVIMWNYKKEFGRVTTEVRSFEQNRIDFSTVDGLRRLQLLTLELTSTVGTIWGKMYQRDFLIRNNLFSDETLPRGQDVEYNVRIFQKISRALYIPDILYHYRYDENTASTAFNEQYAEYVKRFIFALYNDVLEANNNQDFLNKFFERCVHTILSLSVRHTFHAKNPYSYIQNKKVYIQICSEPIIRESIQKASYKNFSIPRKLALFCLKHKIILGIYLIAKFRQIQYSIKQ